MIPPAPEVSAMHLPTPLQRCTSVTNRLSVLNRGRWVSPAARTW